VFTIDLCIFALNHEKCVFITQYDICYPSFLLHIVSHAFSRPGTAQTTVTLHSLLKISWGAGGYCRVSETLTSTHIQTHSQPRDCLQAAHLRAPSTQLTHKIWHCPEDISSYTSALQRLLLFAVSLVLKMATTSLQKLI